MFKISALGLCVGLIASACSSDDGGNDPGDPSRLYLVQGTSGTFTLDDPGTRNSEWVWSLELSGVEAANQVLAFTDAPLLPSETKTETETVAEHIGEWDARFGSEAGGAPDAVISIEGEDEEEDLLLITLTRLVGYDADAATLTFKARVTGSTEPSGALAGFADKADSSIPTSFRDVNLFIDDGSEDSASDDTASKDVPVSINIDGWVREVFPNGHVEISLVNRMVIIAALSESLREQNIRVLPGDRVTVKLSPYDLSSGIVTHRRR